MTKYKVYAKDLDGKKRLLGKVMSDDLGKSIFDMYADECGDEEEIVIVADSDPSSMGRKGGSAKSPAKQASSRENGKKGGRPAKKQGE